MNKDKIYLGVSKDHGNVYLSKASWDCGWYWGFGYIGNKNCHYHFSGLTFDNSKNMFDAIKEHFTSFVITDDSKLWKLCELMQTFYHLQTTAEVLGRGGSHYTANPLSELIKNPKEVTRINEVILPRLFEEIYKLFESN